MTLRIVAQANESEAVIALHGRLSTAEVQEFVRVAAETGRPLRLDLAELTGVDGDGVRALQQLRRSGASLSGVPPYVALLLARTAGEDGPG